MREPEAGEGRGEIQTIRRERICIADSKGHFTADDSVPGHAKRLRRRIDGDNRQRDGREELRPIPCAARDFEDDFSGKQRREPRFDLPQVMLPLRLRVDVVVLFRARRIVCLPWQAALAAI
jgi:hypothetical protein